MAHRSFKDQHDRLWEVWEVNPTMVERRVSRGGAVPFERRHHDVPRDAFPRDLRNGWLAFDSRTERRRLAPTPPGWSELSDAELGSLLDRATARTRPRRLLD